jgi:hypothetical protein
LAAASVTVRLKLYVPGPPVRITTGVAVLAPITVAGLENIVTVQE